MWFTRISIQNPVFATMMMAAFLVLGLFSFSNLKVEQFPDVSFPVVLVAVEYPGASPEVVESDVSRPLEEAVNTIAGLKNLSSRAYEGNAIIIAEFELSIDPVQAAQDVREKIALVRPLLRKEVREPRISRFNPDDFPVVSVVVQSNRPMRELTALANQNIKKRLENLNGVGSATVVGGVKREMQIRLKPTELEANGLGVDQVIAAIRTENQELPSGSIRASSSEQMVQVRARLKGVEDFERLIVGRRGGQPVYLHQVATVTDGEQERESLALVDGVPALSLDVVKSQSANTIEVVDRVRALVKDLQAELPPDISLQLVRDQSMSIRNSVAGVKRTLVEGAVLTVLIVFLFLGSWRSTVITGLTLPISLIGTFLVLYVMGFSVNVLTLLALSICVGLLIDDAIVVRENIVRHINQGKDHKTAALEGTREIGLAVLATTLSIVAVFLPVGFMGGIIGRFFHQFGITVAFAVLLSMFVSFTLDPMLSSVWNDPDAHGPRGQGPIARGLRLFQNLMLKLENGYVRLLGWGLNRPKTVVLLAIASLVTSFGLMRFVGSEFVPQPDNGELNVQYYTPIGSSLELTQTKALQVEQALREFPEVVFTYTTINTGVVQGKHYATTFIRLTDRSVRARTIKDMTPLLRARLSRVAGITVSQIGLNSAVGSGKPVQVSLLGPDNQVLDRLSRQVLDIMAGLPNLVDVDSSSKPSKPTLALRVKREIAADQGLGAARINEALRPLLAGEVASSWLAPDGENYDVTVRLPPDERNQPQDLARLSISSGQMQADGTPRMVALRDVVDIQPTTGPSQINRKALTREILITANVDGAPAGTASNALSAALKTIELPPGYRITLGGSSRDITETLKYAVQALALAIVFIYLILASQFGRFLQPLVIMVSLPMSLIGVILALLLWRSTLNIFSVIGFIMLMGLVTKNAILLVDFANQAVEKGASMRDGLLQAAQVRLRPILMTTLAMVVGMMPLAIGITEGSEQRAPMAHAVIGGVITSTLLTLIVVPVLCLLLDRQLQKRAARAAIAPV